MARKKKGELPSGSIRRQIYDHSEPQFDKNGNPIIDPKTGKQKMKRIYRSITASSASEADLIKAEIKAGKKALENLKLLKSTFHHQMLCCLRLPSAAIVPFSAMRSALL